MSGKSNKCTCYRCWKGPAWMPHATKKRHSGMPGDKVEHIHVPSDHGAYKAAHLVLHTPLSEGFVQPPVQSVVQEHHFEVRSQPQESLQAPRPSSRCRPGGWRVPNQKVS